MMTAITIAPMIMYVTLKGGLPALGVSGFGSGVGPGGTGAGGVGVGDGFGCGKAPCMYEAS